MFEEIPEKHRGKFIRYLFVSMPIGLVFAFCLLYAVCKFISFRPTLGEKAVVAISFVACYFFGAFSYYKRLAKGEDNLLE